VRDRRGKVENGAEGGERGGVWGEGALEEDWMMRFKMGGGSDGGFSVGLWVRRRQGASLRQRLLLNLGLPLFEEDS